MGLIKKIITIAVVVVVAYFLYQGAIIGYNMMIDQGSSVERGAGTGLAKP